MATRPFRAAIQLRASKIFQEASAMSQLSIRLEGYPEKVQRIADTLDSAFPDMLAWEPSEDPADGATIKIEGLEKPLPPVQAPQTNPTTKRRPAALPWHTASDASVVWVPTDRKMFSLARRKPETILAAVAPLGGNKQISVVSRSRFRHYTRLPKDERVRSPPSSSMRSRSRFPASGV